MPRGSRGEHHPADVIGAALRDADRDGRGDRGTGGRARAKPSAAAWEAGRGCADEGFVAGAAVGNCEDGGC